MRLTNDMRDRVRYQIMADVPIVNYQEAMQERVNVLCAQAMPPEVRKVWGNPALRGYLRQGSIYLDCMSLSTPGFHNDDAVQETIRNDSQVKALHELHDAQRDARDALSYKVKANLQACTTDVQFRETFPELAKYLPVPEIIANVPATTDLLDSLKAAGFQPETQAA